MWEFVYSFLRDIVGKKTDTAASTEASSLFAWIKDIKADTSAARTAASDSSSVIGAANPTTANTATVMNYLKKLWDRTTVGPRYLYRIGVYTTPQSAGTAETLFLSVTGAGNLDTMTLKTNIADGDFNNLYIRIVLDGSSQTVDTRQQLHPALLELPRNQGK